MTETVTKVCCFRFAYHIPNLEFLRPKERFVVKVKAVVLLAAKKSQQEGILKLMARKGRSVHSGQKTQKTVPYVVYTAKCRKKRKMPQISKILCSLRSLKESMSHFKANYAYCAILRELSRASKRCLPHSWLQSRMQ